MALVGVCMARGLAQPTTSSPKTEPPEWLNDPKYVNVSRLPQLTNLEAAYATLKPSKGTGTVSFRVLVNTDGQVSEHAVALESPGMHADEFVPALAVLRFKPATRGGQAVYARTVVSFVWPQPSGDETEPALDDVRSYDLEAKPLNQADLAQRIGYPAAAKAAGQQGRIILRVLVDAHGRYVNHVLKRTAGRLLLEAVEAEVANLLFSPAMIGKKPTKAWVEVAFDFGQGQ